MRLKVSECNELKEKSLHGDVVFISNDLDSGYRDGYWSKSPGNSPRPEKSTLNQLNEGQATSQMGLQRGKFTNICSLISPSMYRLEELFVIFGESPDGR